MKVRPSVKKICVNCKVIKRERVVRYLPVPLATPWSGRRGFHTQRHGQNLGSINLDLDWRRDCVVPAKGCDQKMFDEGIADASQVDVRWFGTATYNRLRRLPAVGRT